MPAEGALHHEQPDRREKMLAVILYVAQRAASAPYFGSTKLNKILFHADFAAYRQRGDSITAFEYQALERGPTLRKMRPVLRGMKNERLIDLEPRRVIDYAEEVVVALVDPDYDALEPGEWKFVDEAIEANFAKTGRQMTDEAHEDPAWRAAWRQKEGTTIPFEAVSLSRRDTLTQAEQDHAQALAQEFNLTA